MILVVILHRYRTELETANLGQRDDIHYQATCDELDALSLSERTHLAFQALSRGASRVTLSDSQATPSNCFMIEREEELETELNKVMPGCQFKTWEPTYADAVAHGNLGCSGSSGVAASIQAKAHYTLASAVGGTHRAAWPVV